MGISARLTTTGAVTRYARTADGRGGFTLAYSSQGNISCRISRNRGTNRERGKKDESFAEYTIFTLTSADLAVGDRVTVGALVWEVRYLTRPSRGNHYEWGADLIETET